MLTNENAPAAPPAGDGYWNELLRRLETTRDHAEEIRLLLMLAGAPAEAHAQLDMTEPAKA